MDARVEPLVRLVATRPHSIPAEEYVTCMLRQLLDSLSFHGTTMEPPEPVLMFTARILDEWKRQPQCEHLLERELLLTRLASPMPVPSMVRWLHLMSHLSSIHALSQTCLHRYVRILADTLMELESYEKEVAAGTAVTATPTTTTPTTTTTATTPTTTTTAETVRKWRDLCVDLLTLARSSVEDRAVMGDALYQAAFHRQLSFDARTMSVAWRQQLGQPEQHHELLPLPLAPPPSSTPPRTPLMDPSTSLIVAAVLRRLSFADLNDLLIRLVQQFQLGSELLEQRGSSSTATTTATTTTATITPAISRDEWIRLPSLLLELSAAEYPYPFRVEPFLLDWMCTRWLASGTGSGAPPPPETTQALVLTWLVSAPRPCKAFAQHAHVLLPCLERLCLSVGHGHGHGHGHGGCASSTSDPHSEIASLASTAIAQLQIMRRRPENVEDADASSSEEEVLCKAFQELESEVCAERAYGLRLLRNLMMSMSSSRPAADVHRLAKQHHFLSVFLHFLQHDQDSFVLANALQCIQQLLRHVPPEEVDYVRRLPNKPPALEKLLQTWTIPDHHHHHRHHQNEE